MLKYKIRPEFPKNPFRNVVGEKLSKVKSVVKKKVDDVGKFIIAGEEAGLNLLQGKSPVNVVSNFTETITRPDSKQALMKVVEHQCSHDKIPRTIVQKTSTNVVKQNVLNTNILAVTPPLLCLRNIITIFDGRDLRKSDRSRDNNASRYARFAAHVYRDLEDGVLPFGCKILEKHSTKENLKATLYRDNDDIVCAFAGTGKNFKDWKNNFTQLVGKSKQYDEALEYAKDISYRYPDKRIIFVGHSQGGGEAAYCAYNLGMQAETYNPAGLSIFTILKNEYKASAHINAYVFDTDILNALQDAVGFIQADGDVHRVQANPLLHGIHGILGILKFYKIWFRKIKVIKRSNMISHINVKTF